jgi:GTP cyclohydrolase I
MKIERLIDILEDLFPKNTAIENDRLGLQVYTANNEIKKSLLAMELNEDVAEEASIEGCNAIICFHPLIYKPLESISINDRVGNIVAKLIKNEIALYVVHTNFDSYPRGTNNIFAKKLGLAIESPLIPSPEQEGYGIGVAAYSENQLSGEDLLDRISQICNSPLRFCNGKENAPINKIGIICGSGSSMLRDEYADIFDAFITADVSYHTFHRFNKKMMLIDPGHYEMEQFVPQAMAAELSEECNQAGIELVLSKVMTNPVKYYPKTDDYLNRQTIYRLFNKIME